MRQVNFFKNFPKFVVIHTVIGFGIVNKSEIDVFLELSCFFHDPADVGTLLYVLNIYILIFHYTSKNLKKCKKKDEIKVLSDRDI